MGQYPKLMNILKEFECVQRASKIDPDVVEKEYHSLQNEMSDLKAMIERYKEEYFELIDLEDMFLNDMTSFLVMAQKTMNALKVSIDTMHKSEQEMLNFFAYDTNQQNGARTASLNSMFKDVHSFIEMLSVSKKKVKELEREKKKKNK